MRLGLIGPADGDIAGLARTVEFLLNFAKVSRAVYLGTDGLLDELVGQWAVSLVGPDASAERIWERTADVVVRKDPKEIDAVVRAERARRKLKALESLPSAALRTIEMIGDRVAVLIHDKALLDQEDIFAATFLVYGRSEEAFIKKIGPRWFLSPGRIGGPDGGSAVIEELGDDISVTFFGKDGQVTRTESVGAPRSTRFRVLAE